MYADAGDDTVDAGAGNDVLFGGAGADRLTGGLGDDAYVHGPDDGFDRIAEHGSPHDIDQVLVTGGIVPADIAVHREGDDLVLASVTGTGGVRVEAWFSSAAMRVEAVIFDDGEQWDVAALAAMTGTELPAVEEPVPPVSGGNPEPLPSPDPDPSPPPATADPSPSAGSPPGAAQPPGTEPPAGTQPPASVVVPPATGEAAVDGGPPASVQPPMGTDPPASGIDSPGVGSGPPRVPSEAIADVPGASGSVVEPTRERAVGTVGSASADPAVFTAATSPAVAATATQAVAVTEAPVVAPRLVGAPGDASPTTAHGVVSVPSPMESLAAGGFVSPGRTASIADDGTESLSAETPVDPPADVAEPPAESAPLHGQEAMARYWRWMHARMDALMAAEDVDDAESAGLFLPMPLSSVSASEGVRLDPVRAVGVRGVGGFDLRAFEGLRDGILRLG
jgi:hypothetical protein